VPAGPPLTPSGAEPLRLELLHEAPGLPAVPLPDELAQAYGGSLGFRPPVLYGNLVATVDGITALDEHTSPAVVAARSRADRFVMGLLRAFAEAILVGASTLRAEPRHLWLPEKVHPDGAAAFAALRSALALPERPQFVVVTASGKLDLSLPAFAGGGLILTTSGGAGALGEDLPDGVRVRVAGDGPLLDGRRIVAAIRDEGHRVVLTEGGPHLMGTLLEANLLDELFLTVSPLFAGDRLVPGRRGLVEGVHFGPGELRTATLLSVRLHGPHLFLRYAVGDRRPA
jgi:riboflavin biosynthesis pyrimidine reductase